MSVARVLGLARALGVTHGLRVARAAVVALSVAIRSWAHAQSVVPPSDAVQITGGRFSVIALPGDRLLAQSMLSEALARDTFPGLVRPRAHVVIAIAPDTRRFREWAGNGAPEWGAAIAFPAQQRIVMQGHRAPSTAGDPRVTLRHELAHLALHEAMGARPSRWFDEGYASFSAGEWGRDEMLATNIALLIRRFPGLDELDPMFEGGSSRAQQGYALSQRAVAELSALDPQRGLTLFFEYWRSTESLDQALRRAYGITEAGFEQRWKSNTRSRFGALALVADVTFGTLLMLMVLGPLWWLRRKRDRRRLLSMQVADALQDRRERESALEALLGLTGEVTTSDPPPFGGGERPKADEDNIK